MIRKLNNTIDLCVDATSYIGLTDYGKIFIGDQGFEFYHNSNINKFIQIPWKEVELVVASVLFKGRWIPRYMIQTKNNGHFTFSSKQPKTVLKAIRVYVAPDRMVRSLGLFDVLKRAYKTKFQHK